MLKRKRMLEKFIEEMKAKFPAIANPRGIAEFLKKLEDPNAKNFWYAKMSAIRHSALRTRKLNKPQHFIKGCGFKTLLYLENGERVPHRKKTLTGYMSRLDNLAWNSTQEGSYLRMEWRDYSKERA